MYTNFWKYRGKLLRIFESSAVIFENLRLGQESGCLGSVCTSCLSVPNNQTSCRKTWHVSTLPNYFDDHSILLFSAGLIDASIMIMIMNPIIAEKVSNIKNNNTFRNFWFLIIHWNHWTGIVTDRSWIIIMITNPKIHIVSERENRV